MFFSLIKFLTLYKANNRINFSSGNPLNEGVIKKYLNLLDNTPMKNQGVLYLMQIFSGYNTDWMSKTGHFGLD